MVPLLLFYLLLGFNFAFPSVAMRYWLMDTVQVTPAQMAAIFGVVSIPWCLKPLFGFTPSSLNLIRVVNEESRHFPELKINSVSEKNRGED